MLSLFKKSIFYAFFPCKSDVKRVCPPQNVSFPHPSPQKCSKMCKKQCFFDHFSHVNPMLRILPPPSCKLSSPLPQKIEFAAPFLGGRGIFRTRFWSFLPFFGIFSEFRPRGRFFDPDPSKFEVSVLSNGVYGA